MRPVIAEVLRGGRVRRLTCLIVFRQRSIHRAKRPPRATLFVALLPEPVKRQQGTYVNTVHPCQRMQAVDAWRSAIRFNLGQTTLWNAKPAVVPTRCEDPRALLHVREGESRPFPQLT